MGIFDRLISGARARGGSFERDRNGIDRAGSDHAIAPGRVLAPTHPAAITPTNPGNFASIRTAAILNQPRYFNRQEAIAIRHLATEKRQQLSSTRSAYKGLKQIEKADAVVHTEHREYESTVAKMEVRKKRADTRHAKQLHGLRSAYAQMAGGLESADQRAAAQIAANQQQQQQRQQHFMQRLQQAK